MFTGSGRAADHFSRRVARKSSTRGERHRSRCLYRTVLTTTAGQRVARWKHHSVCARKAALGQRRWSESVLLTFHLLDFTAPRFSMACVRRANKLARRRVVLCCVLYRGWHLVGKGGGMVEVWLAAQIRRACATHRHLYRPFQQRRAHAPHLSVTSRTSKCRYKYTPDACPLVCFLIGHDCG